LVKRERSAETAEIAGQQGVAVALCFRDAGRADRPASADRVLHENRLCQRARHVIAHKTCEHIIRAAGRERHDDRDGPAWIALGDSG
jgi:hypothetical protein